MTEAAGQAISSRSLNVADASLILVVGYILANFLSRRNESRRGSFISAPENPEMERWKGGGKDLWDELRGGGVGG